ncbi:RTA1 like protein-domain-containing protein [Diplogelasinospora grovesii]|uniref:RTA1 like protein-domain-containing protein n=1 Tax=Diplogelasinospora grovesii TaxID=303347 RepID=A0AAN6S549_9PEZI|nr:RTA1 like protein-domain-containing protein [Diplogelasinospora grovesii]
MAIVRSFYPYQPSQAAAAVVCALFSIGFLLSFYQTIRHKAWIWCVMVLAIGMEAVGYGARTASAGDVTARTVYIVQFCLIILAPVLMAGIIYVVFGRIVFLVVPPQARTTRLLWIPPRWLTPIFVGFDIFALFLQLVGAVIVSSTQVTDTDAVSKLNRGKDIAMAGVTLQIIAFGFFSIIAARFHFTSTRFIDDMKRRVQAVPGDKFMSLEGSTRKFRADWRRLLYAVNISCIMVLIRSAYREADFEAGKTGNTQLHEYFPYVLDALPMLVVVILLTVFTPGAYVSMGFRQPKDQPRNNTSGSDGDAFVMGSRVEAAH